MAIVLPEKKPPEKNNLKENSKDDKFELSNPVYSLDDLVLNENVKFELKKSINYLKYQDEIFTDWGLSTVFKNRKKVVINLYGESGTGKTMAAHVIASQFNKKIVHINYSDIESKYVGETPKNITAAFKFAKENNAIIFFDEADAILSRRVTNMTSATDTSVNQTRSVLLTILNDYDQPVIFATNFIENYDPAFLRRILFNIEFKLPDEIIRKQLFQKYIPIKLPNTIDLDAISSVSEGLSPSEISNSILLSSFAAKTKGKTSVSTDEVLESIQSIIKAKMMNKNSNITTSIREIDPSTDIVNMKEIEK